MTTSVVQGNIVSERGRERQHDVGNSGVVLTSNLPWTGVGVELEEEGASVVAAPCPHDLPRSWRAFRPPYTNTSLR